MRLLAALLLASLFATPAAHAFENPDLISLGVGYYDALKNDPRNEAIDFRAEYRFGYDLSKSATGTDLSWFAIRPFAGLEFTHDGAAYGLGGFVFDIKPVSWWVISPNVGVGLYHDGDGKNLGSFIEFRSTIETGILFDNGMRLTGAFGHISNAGITDRNPGTEIATLYVHLPADWIFGE